MEELPPQLVTYEKGTFLYKTFTQRLPEIITKLIDHINRVIYSDNGENEELSKVLKSIVKLKYELCSNKPFLRPFITDSFIDSDIYNLQFDELKLSEELCWFNCPSLQAECYFYRKICECFKLSEKYKDYDYFQKFKANAMSEADTKIRDLIAYTMKIENDDSSERSMVDVYEKIGVLLQFSLWGNKADLSLSAGNTKTKLDDHPSFICFDSLRKLRRDFLLCDNTDDAVHVLGRNYSTKKITIDYILDNCGLELISDLCLAFYLIFTGVADKVNFHVKRIPWFVSDVTKNDFYETIKMLSGYDKNFGDLVKIYIDQEKITVDDHIFWTLAYSFSSMVKIAPDLYSSLSKSSDLCIFKGDLNYRKLVGDLNWPYNTQLSIALNGFNHKLIALRTLKCNTVAGLPDHILERIDELPSDWMTSGDYGVIQVANF